jgi:ElaB/YqjD/DUF883 family membrane-anchored ribosome-binding protein
MDDEPEVIRRQMEETRSSLSDKIERLEQQVVGTVQNTTQAVNDTVESVKEAVHGTVTTVKDTVSDTVGAVKDALDVRGYVREYPWASFGAAVATGFVGGLLFDGGRRANHRIAELHSRGEPAFSYGRDGSNGSRRFPEEYEPTARAAAFTAPAPAEPSLVHQLTERFGPEIDKLKGLAIGAVGALVRDLVARPTGGQVGDQLSRVIDDVTRKLGGEPIRGPLLQGCDVAAAGKSSRERDTVSESRRARAGFSA